MEYTADHSDRIPGDYLTWRNPAVPACQQYAADRVYRRMIYIRYFRVRDRTGNGSSGVSVYDIRQGDTAYIDPDRRAWGDRMYDAVLFPASQADRA